MKAFLISDAEYKTPVFERLNSQLKEYLAAKGYDIEETAVGRDRLAFCKGCFGCWVKKPGECVVSDDIGRINRTYINSDLTVYLCPVVFGQFSANIKNVLDRWLPNILPFFIVRKDGSTMHPARYSSYPMQMFIGYGDRLDDEDKKLFLDIINNHRSDVEAFVYADGTELRETLNGFKYQRAGGKL